MKIKDYHCKCGYSNFFFANNGNHIGIYCSYCGKWLKWADKDEQNLVMKHGPILNKIITEIKGLDADDAFWGYYDAIADVLDIIDKYKEEMEEQIDGQ